MQAYGWSLPARQSKGSDDNSSTTEDDSESAETKLQTRTSSSGIPVPVPVYCRPLMEKEPGMKVRA